MTTADGLAFAQTKAVFGGMSRKESVMSPKPRTNHAGYGHDVRPTDILIRQEVNREQATKLVAVVTITTPGVPSPQPNRTASGYDVWRWPV